jgi:rfaE bifunctional protein nucleotidyltransferase chain/domain
MTERLGADAERLRSLGIDPAAVERAALALAGGIGAGGKVLTFGNGGSAADAQHLAAELVGRFERDRAPMPAVALTTDAFALTAIANDYGFERVFARQVEALGRRDDVAVAFSTSGTSANVLAGVEAAASAGMTTLGFCGNPGCPLCERVDIAVAADRDRTADIQEGHLLIVHSLCRALEAMLVNGGTEVLPPLGSVVTLSELLALRERWTAAGRVVVWTNGAFDHLHTGHLATLEESARLGDVLVVGVNSDAAVSRLKGEGRPLVPAAERAGLLAALRSVDYAVIFDEDTPEAALDALRPDIHCKGDEYRPPDGKPIPERTIVEAYGGRVEFLPMVPGRSTTEFVGRIGET